MKQRWDRFWQDNLPACALFLLLYAFGLSCGLAAFSEEYRACVLPLLRSALAGGLWAADSLRALCYACAFSVAWSCVLLLSGFHLLLLPVWVFAIFFKAFASGLCAKFCIALSTAGLVGSGWFLVAFFLPLLTMLPVELLFGTLPLIRATASPRIDRRDRRDGEDDEDYLARGLRLAFCLLLLTALQAALIPFLLSIVLAR